MASLSRAISNSLQEVIAEDQLYTLVMPVIGLGSEDSEDMAAATVTRAVLNFLLGLKPQLQLVLQPVNPVRSLAFLIYANYGCQILLLMCRGCEQKHILMSTIFLAMLMFHTCTCMLAYIFKTCDAL